MILSLLAATKPAVPAPPAGHAVTWINVEKPAFDLVGVILSSLGITGMLALGALALGAALGWAFIRRSQRAERPFGDELSLHLTTPRA